MSKQCNGGREEDTGVIAAIAELPIDVWTIVCKNLKPCDIIKLSKVNRFLDLLLRVELRDFVTQKTNHFPWLLPHGPVSNYMYFDQECEATFFDGDCGAMEN